MDQPADCCMFHFMEMIDKSNETRYDYNMIIIINRHD